MPLRLGEGDELATHKASGTDHGEFHRETPYELSWPGVSPDQAPDNASPPRRRTRRKWRSMPSAAADSYCRVPTPDPGPTEDFRRDSDLFATEAAKPEFQGGIAAAVKRGFQTRSGAALAVEDQ